MNKETRSVAKDIYSEKAELFDRPIPHTGLGWFIKFHFTVDGQVAIWNAKSEIEARNATPSPGLEVDLSPELLPSDLEQQSFDQ